MLEGGGGVKKFLSLAPEGVVEMLILSPIIGYLCFCVFNNSCSNKKTHEKGKEKSKPHFTRNFLTYSPT